MRSHDCERRLPFGESGLGQGAGLESDGFLESPWVVF